jgi:hypothetical protein
MSGPRWLPVCFTPVMCEEASPQCGLSRPLLTSPGHWHPSAITTPLIPRIPRIYGAIEPFYLSQYTSLLKPLTGIRTPPLLPHPTLPPRYFRLPAPAVVASRNRYPYMLSDLILDCYWSIVSDGLHGRPIRNSIDSYTTTSCEILRGISFSMKS